MTKTPEQIHDNMSKVRSKDTGIEKMLRKELWSRGLGYQKNSKKVFGKPDIVFIGRKVAVFCDSEFWHGYDWERSKENLKTNKEFWTQKIENNMDRDREVTDALEKDGWTGPSSNRPTACSTSDCTGGMQGTQSLTKARNT